MSHIDIKLDVSGLNCPIPILYVKKALHGMQYGQILQVICTDPDSVREFACFHERTEHSVLESRELGDKFFYLVQRG